MNLLELLIGFIAGVLVCLGVAILASFAESGDTCTSCGASTEPYSTKFTICTVCGAKN